MVFARWSPSNRRFVAISLAMVALFLLGDALVAPVVSTFVRQGERIADLEAHYRRFAEVASRKGALELRLAALDREKTWRNQLLDGPAAADAGTLLQQRIRAAADTAGAQLQSFEPIEGSAPHGFSKPGVRVELQAAGEPLALFLETLRNAGEVIVFENVSLRSPGAGSPHDKLQLRMELFGYWYPREPAP